MKILCNFTVRTTAMINIQKLLVIVYPNIANLLIAGDRDRDPFKNTTSPYSIMKIRYNLNTVHHSYLGVDCWALDVSFNAVTSAPSG